MEFTELADYAVPGGTLTEWIPSVGPHARTPELAGWRPDDRPTSYVHEAHLRSSRASTREGRESWLGAAFEIDGPLDKAAFRQTVLDWIDRHEAMRSNASFDDNNQLTRVTAEPGAIDIWQVEQETCSQSTEISEHLNYVFDEYTSPLAWPAYAFVTLEHLGSDVITVFFAADHSIIDGLSTVLIPHEISVLYRQHTQGLPADLFRCGSYLDFGASERRQHMELDASSDAITIWRDFIDHGAGKLPSFPLDIGAPRVDGAAQSGLSAWVFDAESADAFSIACRKTGNSYFAGLLGVMALASKELTGRTDFRTVTPVHTREQPEWVSALGWFVGLCPIEFDIADAHSFGDAATHAAGYIAATKEVARVPMDRIFAALGRPLIPEFVVSFMDVRFAPMAESWTQWNARALRSKNYEHDVYIWINRTPHGVNIAARYPNTDTATTNVHQFIGAVRRILEEVSATGAYAIAPEDDELAADRPGVVTGQ